MSSVDDVPDVFGSLLNSTLGIYHSKTNMVDDRKEVTTDYAYPPCPEGLGCERHKRR